MKHAPVTRSFGGACSALRYSRRRTSRPCTNGFAAAGVSNGSMPLFTPAVALFHRPQSRTRAHAHTRTPGTSGMNYIKQKNHHILLNLPSPHEATMNRYTVTHTHTHTHTTNYVAHSCAHATDRRSRGLFYFFPLRRWVILGGAFTHGTVACCLFRPGRPPSAAIPPDLNFNQQQRQPTTNR